MAVRNQPVGSPSTWIDRLLGFLFLSSVPKPVPAWDGWKGASVDQAKNQARTTRSRALGPTLLQLSKVLSKEVELTEW